MVFSADVAPAPTGRRPLFCSLGASAPFALADVRQLPLPVPERSLAAELLLHGRRICTVASVHIPFGVTWKDGKDETFRALAAWLGQVAEPSVLGIDANSPAIDHPDLARTEWWRPAEALLHSPDAPHRLQNSFRCFLADHPAELDRITKERPDGPLAITHLTGMKRRDNPRRYDFIYVSPQVTVHEVRHHHEEAVAAGSDLSYGRVCDVPHVGQSPSVTAPRDSRARRSASNPVAGA